MLVAAASVVLTYLAARIGSALERLSRQRLSQAENDLTAAATQLDSQRGRGDALEANLAAAHAQAEAVAAKLRHAIVEINAADTAQLEPVEQQRNATHEISRNVSEAVAGITQISKNVNEAADGATQASKSISEIASGANEVARNVAEAAAGANDLTTKIAESAVMVSEASRYTRRASGASRETKAAMHQMMVAVDRVCDAVRELKKHQTRVLVQDEATSVVWGMPGSAVRAGCADEVLPLGQIA